MTRLMLKILLCSALCLTLLMAPLALETYPSGSSYALSRWFPYFPDPKPKDPDPRDNQSPAPVPEPATWILFGAGAIGLAAFRKRVKK